MEEIREIPEGWESVELTDYIKFQKSGLSRAIVSQDIGIPVIISGNIQNGKLCTNELKYWYREDPQGSQVENYILKENDILLCFINSVDQIGKVCIFKGFNREAIYTTNLFRIQPNKRVNNEYLYFKLSSNYIQSEIKKIVKPAVNQASFTKAEFQKIQLIAPKSIIEQQKISEILSTIDQNIEKTEQTIEKYINIKNGLMDDLLTGKRRIKDGKWVVETEFKEVDGSVRIPKDWEEGVISDLADINPKKNIKKLNKWDLVSFIRMEDTSEESKIINMSDKLLSEVEKGYTNFHDNDILFAKITPCLENGKGGLASNLTNGFGFGSTEFHVLRPKKIYSTQLLYQYSKYNKLRAKAASLMIGSAGQQRIQKDFFESYIIGIPTENEQTIIGDILSKQDHLIEKEQQYLQKLKSLKSGLMEDLLTGKVRVKLSN